jgi:hypothetical protein
MKTHISLLLCLPLFILVFALSSCGTDSEAESFDNYKVEETDVAVEPEEADEPEIKRSDTIAMLTEMYTQDNADLLQAAYREIENNQAEYEYTYYELPESPDLKTLAIASAGDAAKDAAIDIAGEILKTNAISSTVNIYSNMQLINEFFHVDTTPTTLMAYVSADSASYTTILTEIIKTGEVTDDTLYLAVHTTGQLYQRIDAIERLYQGNGLEIWDDLHKTLSIYYEKYIENARLIEILQAIDKQSSDTVQNKDPSGIVQELFDKYDPYSFYPSIDIPVFNYDSERVREIEEVSGKQSTIASLIPNMLVKMLLSESLESSNQDYLSSISAALVKLNAFTANMLNADIEALREVKAKINAECKLLWELQIAGKDSPYIDLRNDLAFIDKNELMEILDMSSLLDEYNDLCGLVKYELGLAVYMYDTVLESPDRVVALNSILTEIEQYGVHNDKYNDKVNELTIKCIDIMTSIVDVVSKELTADPFIFSGYYSSKVCPDGLRKTKVSSRSIKPDVPDYLRIIETFGRNDDAVYISYYDRNGHPYYIKNEETGEYIYINQDGVPLSYSDNTLWVNNLHNNIEASTWLYNNAYAPATEYYSVLTSRTSER